MSIRARSISLVVVALVLALATPSCKQHPDDLPGPKRLYKIWLNPMVLAAGNTPVGEVGYISDDAILRDAVAHVADCDLADVIANSIPSGLMVSGKWGQQGQRRDVYFNGEFAVEVPTGVDTTPHNEILLYVFKRHGRFYRYCRDWIHSTVPGGGLPYPNWELLGSDAAILEAINKWVDWEDRPMAELIEDMKDIWRAGIYSNEYSNLPIWAKSMAVAFAGDETAGYVATQKIRVWILRNHTPAQYDGVLLPDDNGVAGRSYSTPGQTAVISDYMPDNFNSHSHIFVNQRVLRYRDPTVLSECSMNNMEAVRRRRANALQTTVMHELVHVFTLPDDVHCATPGCMMNTALQNCKRDWICSSTWSDIQFYFNWGLD